MRISKLISILTDNGCTNIPVKIRKHLTKKVKVLFKSQRKVTSVVRLLPPAYIVRREDTVFTGVCLLTFRGYPLPRSRQGGTPFPGPGRVRISRWEVPPSQVQVGDTPSQVGGGGYPLPEQHSEHLLRGGWCASCVHAGGLSCIDINNTIYDL